MYQISRIRTCIIARPESVPHHSAIICAVPLLLFPVHLSIGLPWPPPCWLCLITPTLLTILYLSSAICIYSFILRFPSLLLFLFLLLFIFLFYLSFLYLYHYTIYTSILVILLYSYIPILYYSYHSLFLPILLSRPSLKQFKFFYPRIIRRRLSITYFIFI